jgi:hypothetical protein
MTFTTEKPINKEIKVTFRCVDKNNKILLFGVENNSKVNCRYEYIEKDIVDNLTVNISEKNIILDTVTQYSFIEHIVAMNKKLLETLYDNINGKWYFTRLQLTELIDMSDIKSVQLVFKSNFQFKLTKTALIINIIEMGFIYFSLIEKKHS